MFASGSPSLASATIQGIQKALRSTSNYETQLLTWQALADAAMKKAFPVES